MFGHIRLAPCGLDSRRERMADYDRRSRRGKLRAPRGSGGGRQPSDGFADRMRRRRLLRDEVRIASIRVCNDHDLTTPCPVEIAVRTRILRERGRQEPDGMLFRVARRPRRPAAARWRERCDRSRLPPFVSSAGRRASRPERGRFRVEGSAGRSASRKASSKRWADRSRRSPDPGLPSLRLRPS